MSLVRLECVNVGNVGHVQRFILQLCCYKPV